MYKKVTFTLPEKTVMKLRDLAPKGERSTYLARVIEEKAIEQKIRDVEEKMTLEEANEELQKLKKNLTPITQQEILDAIDKGRP